MYSYYGIIRAPRMFLKWYSLVFVHNCTLIAIYNVTTLKLFSNTFNDKYRIGCKHQNTHFNWQQRGIKQVSNYTCKCLVAQWTHHEFHIWDPPFHVFIKHREDMKEIFLGQRKAELPHSSLKICNGNKAITHLIQLFECSPECLEVWYHL